MNRDDILKLEAGRELDALVAEKVMGMGDQHVVNQTADGKFVPTGKIWYECLEYSTNIAAAWEVVKEMSAKNYHAYLEVLSSFCKAAFIDAKTGIGKIAKADTYDIPLAICRAALLALEEK